MARVFHLIPLAHRLKRFLRDELLTDWTGWARIGAEESEDEIDSDRDAAWLSRIALYLVMMARERNADAGRVSGAGKQLSGDGER